MVALRGALCLAQRRASAKCSPGQTFEDLDPPGLLGTESFQILRFFSNHNKLSAFWSRDTWPNYSCMQNCAIWAFERWSSHASLAVYFWLSAWAVRCCSYLAQPCEVFHNWGDKTGGTLIDQSHDAQPESGETSEVVTSTGVRKCDRSQDIWLESYLPIGVRHATKVMNMTGVMIYLHYKQV
jgi:hypothetical protein